MNTKKKIMGVLLVASLVVVGYKEQPDFPIYDNSTSKLEVIYRDSSLFTDLKEETFLRVTEELKRIEEETAKEELRKERERLKSPSRGETLRVTNINGGSFKSYMDYRAITNKSSTQWKLQQQATTNMGYRMYDGCYMVAVGSGVGEVGKRGKLTLTNGLTYDIIVGDQKANKDTDGSNIYHKSDGSAIEFIVDKRTLSSTAKRMGDISYCSNVNFSGAVKSISIEQ